MARAIPMVGWYDLPGKPDTAVHIREATPEDYPGIAAICDGVFDDFDVFPYLLEKYVAAPNRIVHVAEDKNGRIVGCLASVILDNGRTFVAEGARTAKDYEGSGVQKKMRPVNWYETKRRFPNLREEFARCASIHIDFFQDRKEKVLKLHFTQLFVTFYDPLDQSKLDQVTCSDNLDLLKFRLPIDQMEPVSPDEFSHLLGNKVACEHLFPYGMVYIHSEMYELLEENIKDIYEGRGHTLVFGLPAQNGERCDSEPQVTGVHYDSLSLSLALRAKKGWMFEIAYFGRDDLNSILAHTMKQMSLFQDTEGLDINFELVFQKDLISSDTVIKVIDFLKAQTNLKEVVLLDQNILDVDTRSKPPKSSKL